MISLNQQLTVGLLLSLVYEDNFSLSLSQERADRWEELCTQLPLSLVAPAVQLWISALAYKIVHLYIALAVYVTLENALFSLALMYRIMSNDTITWVSSSPRIPNETSRQIHRRQFLNFL